MPVWVAIPIPDDIPGTILNGIWLFLKNTASSPPLPKINGSPPLSLITIFSNFTRAPAKLYFTNELCDVVPSQKCFGKVYYDVAQ